MPGLIRSQERAKRINDSPFMKDIRAEIEKRGVIVLSDAWFAGGMAAKGGCIVKPDDIKGMKFRSAGPTFAAMWQAAGASIVSLAVERSLQRAARPASSTAPTPASAASSRSASTSQSNCLTAPGNNALWFMYEPVLMSKKSFDRLNKQQQDVLHRGRQEGGGLSTRRRPKRLEREDGQGLQGPQGEGRDATPADYDAWLDVARRAPTPSSPRKCRTARS